MRRQCQSHCNHRPPVQRCGRVPVWLHAKTNACHETLEFVAVNGAQEFPLEFLGMGIWLGPEREQHSDVAAFLRDCMSKQRVSRNLGNRCSKRSARISARISKAQIVPGTHAGAGLWFAAVELRQNALEFSGVFLTQVKRGSDSCANAPHRDLLTY